jgi:sn-glycerol 3-phosphate transport system substrate-binding protein
MRRTSISLVLVSLLVSFVAVACGGDTGDGNGTRSGGRSRGTGDLPDCPLPALDAASEPVAITYWHAMTRVNADELERLTNEFNAEHPDIRVTLSAAPSYADNLTRYKAGLGTGNLPDLFQGEDTALQTLIDSRSVLPVQSCIDAESLNTSDFVARVLAYYSVEDVLWPMPFNDSNPILYYDKNAFRRAGLDPDEPPATLREVEAAARAIVESGATPYGIAIKTDSWVIEHWLAKAAHTLVDNGNGRDGRATRVTFDDETGVELFTWIDRMVRSKLALSTGSAEVDHYLAVANRQAAMTIDTSAALGTIDQILGGGEYREVELGTGPMPAPDDPEGGILVGGAANYVVNRSSEEQQAAAYEFAKFLADPQVQAEWAATTGYVPVRSSATTLEPLVTKWQQQPGYRIAYEQLLAGGTNDATAGPVVGPYGARGTGVRGAIIDAVTRMLNGDVAPADAVAEAAEHSNAAITEYNARVG